MHDNIATPAYQRSGYMRRQGVVYVSNVFETNVPLFSLVKRECKKKKMLTDLPRAIHASHVIVLACSWSVFKLAAATANPYVYALWKNGSWAHKWRPTPLQLVKAREASSLKQHILSSRKKTTEILPSCYSCTFEWLWESWKVFVNEQS